VKLLKKLGPKMPGNRGFLQKDISREWDGPRRRKICRRQKVWHRDDVTGADERRCSANRVSTYVGKKKRGGSYCID